MRILSLTAGAGGMYCGTCMRDNALAAELIRQGHDVLLVPIYTPTRTDEENVSSDKIFFGGISVYLQQHFALFRKMPAALDALWDSRWALKKATARSIPVDPRFLGEMTVSMLKGENGLLRKEVHKMVDWLRTEPAPDIIELPYSLLIALAGPLKRALNRPVVCTLQGEDLFLNGLLEPYRSECLALIRHHIPQVDAFVAVSRYYADFMTRYLQLPPERVHVSQLGINMAGYGRVPRRPGPFRVGYFARIAPEKGLHILVEALARPEFQATDIELHAAGYLPPEHEGYLRVAESRMRQAGLGKQFRYHGTVNREGKIRFLQSLDVLSVPSTYDEPKGIFVFEAMANGVPVVQPRRGAYPEILARTGGGLLAEPDDPASVAEAILKLHREPELRQRLADEAYHGVRKHYSIEHMAARSLEIYRDVAASVQV